MKIGILFYLIGAAFSAYSQVSDSSINENPKNKMKIEIWSDVACPFCYIGKRKFEEALAQFENRDQVEFVWKSYQLDPTPQSELPADKDMYQYLADRKGISYRESEKLHENVTNMAESVGLKYNFEIAKISNTFDAARLIHMASIIGKMNEAKEKLFEAHFVLGLDVAKEEVLVQIGQEIGLEGEAVVQMLRSNLYADDVNSDIEEAREIGVTGVPFFVLDRKYAVSGAQDVSVFLEYISKAYDDWVKVNKN